MTGHGSRVDGTAHGRLPGWAAFCLLAVALTWALGGPLTWYLAHEQVPPPWALLGGGASAFGPTLAAWVVARRRGEWPSVRERFWVPWGPTALALVTLLGLHLVASGIEMALGGSPHQNLLLPGDARTLGGLGVLRRGGGGIGWRGYGWPRLRDRFGPVVGNLVLGTVWTAWHLVMWTTSEGPPGLGMVAAGWVELTAGSFVVAALMDRFGGSLAVAIAFHMGAHLDNTFRAPQDELRLRGLRLLVLVAAAFIAGTWLTRRAAEKAR